MDGWMNECIFGVMVKEVAADQMVLWNSSPFLLTHAPRLSLLSLELCSQHHVVPEKQHFLLAAASAPQKSAERSLGAYPSIKHNPFSAKGS